MNENVEIHYSKKTSENEASLHKIREEKEKRRAVMAKQPAPCEIEKLQVSMNRKAIVIVDHKQRNYKSIPSG